MDTRGEAKGVRERLVLVLLPLVFVATAWWLRESGGPYWMWHTVDPSYYYLFDSLNLAALTPPGHPYHPGTPVQLIGALVLRLVHPFATASELRGLVLDDPEMHLRLIGTTLILLGAVGLWLAGRAALRLTANPVLAWAVQAGPFLSMVTMKNAYHAKPEAFLVFVMALMMAVALRGLEEPEDRVRRLAVPLGVIAGLGVATKLTAAPIFLLPVFLLGGLRPLLFYGLVSAAAFGMFVAPALPSVDKFLAFTGQAFLTAGDYTSGPQTVVDLSTYPHALAKVASRPVVHVPILLGLLAAGIAFARRRKGLGVPGPELRLLGGIALADAAQVAAVAKQPVANYMVPSYMISGLAIAMAYRFVAGLGWGGEALRRRARIAVSVLLIGGLAAQVGSVGRLQKELDGWRRQALGFDEGRFAACARIYFFPASNLAFALPLADWWTGLHSTDAVAERLPPHVYWFEQNTMELRDARGPRALAPILAEAPCVMLRGGHRGPIGGYLHREAPETTFERTCSTRDETVLTHGVACNGL